MNDGRPTFPVDEQKEKLPGGEREIRYCETNPKRSQS